MQKGELMLRIEPIYQGLMELIKAKNTTVIYL